jgi:hypothetical protein
MRVFQKPASSGALLQEMPLEQALVDSLKPDLNRYGLQRAVAALLLASVQGRPVTASDIQSVLRGTYQVQA